MVLGHPEVVQLYGMGRAQIRRDFRLPAEPLDREVGRVAVPGAEHLGPDQLDGRRPGQHAVGSLVDLAHAPASQQFAQAIAPHFAGPGHFPTQAVDDPRAEIGKRSRGDGREAHPEVLAGIRNPHLAGEVEQQQRQRRHCGGRQGRRRASGAGAPA